MHNSDRIRLIQNPDESYCLYKTTLAIQKSLKVNEPILGDDDSSEGLSSLNPGGKYLSERRDISDGDDTVHFFADQDQESGDELFVEGEEVVNSVEASDSSNEDARLAIGDEDDSFELQRINEEEEFQLEEQL